ACPQPFLCPVVLVAALENLGWAAQHDPAEAAPIFVVTVYDKRSLRVFQNIAYPLQGGVAPFRFLIYRDVERVIGHRIAHRDHMRRPVAVGGREMADPAMIEKTALCTGKHCAILPDAGPVAYRFGRIVRS